MTTPITAKVVEVPKPERVDRFYVLSQSRPGYVRLAHSVHSAIVEGDEFLIYVPGTRTLAAQAAERERILAGLRRLASRIIADTSLSVIALEAAIAYIEGQQPAPATDRRGE